jgi:hypothetical protein
MKRKITLFAVFALTGILLWRCGTHTGSGSGQSATDSTTVHLPSNVLMLDSVSQQTISTWFAGGVVSPGGLIFPANSLGFKVIDTTTNVDFYKWSEQMFLWITSPVGNKSIVLESPTFYTVIDNRDGTRNLSQNNFGKQVTMKANLPQVGPHGLHLIRAKNGKRFEVETSDEKKKETVIDGSGKTIEVGQVKLVGNNVAQFLDVSGKTISHPKPLIVAKSNTSNIVHRFKAGKKFIFLDANGNQIETEEGQAGGDNVLISQNGSMVYYMTMVNDVYAWYLTMFKDTTQKNVAKQFPTDTAGMLLNTMQNWAMPTHWPWR